MENEGKTKFILFQKPRDNGNLPLQLPNLKIKNYEIKRPSSTKFLGILVDENHTWVDPEAVARRCSVKKVFLEISQNSQENTCARVSFLIKWQASGLQLY